jgi:hypothetical protein
MHQVRGIAQDHAAEDSSQVYSCLNVCYLLPIELERIVFAPKDSRDPQKKAINAQFSAKEA